MASPNLVQQLEGLLPAVCGWREQIEHDRRLPAGLVTALRDTAVFALEVPAAIGGREADPVEILRAIETISRADGSTGWCVGVGVANNGAAGLMQEAGAREVFSDPSAPVAGVFAPSGAAGRVDGGVRVSGRWQFASGVTHCDWVWAGCMVMEDGRPHLTSAGPEIIYAAIPVRSVDVHDTWFVSGLCGTASHDISVADVFVPESRVFAFGSAPQQPGPLYRLPALGWFVSHLAAVSLGLARGALDDLVSLAQTKTPAFSTAVLADRPVAQVEVARAEAALGAARAFLFETVDDLWRTVVEGGEPTAQQLAKNRVAAVNATDVGAVVTRTASVLAGGSAIRQASALQRHTRDAEAIAHHFTVAPHVWEDAGRVFLGRKPTAPMF